MYVMGIVTAIRIRFVPLDRPRRPQLLRPLFYVHGTVYSREIDILPGGLLWS